MKTKYNLELFKLQAELCKTFADPSRLIIIQELRDGEKSVSELQSALDIPQPVVSHHLAILKNKGVVRQDEMGKILITTSLILKFAKLVILFTRYC